MRSRTGSGRASPARRLRRRRISDPARPAPAGSAECSAQHARQARHVDPHAGPHGRADATPSAHRCPWRRSASPSGSRRPARLAFSSSLSSSNDTLPMPAWMMPAFSARNSTWPPLAAVTAPLHVHRHGAQPRVRHQAARAEDLTQPPDHAHHVRRRDAAVEVDLAGLHLLGQVLGAHHVGAGGQRLLGLRRRGRTRRRARSCRCRSAGWSARAPSGRHGAGRCRGSSTSRPSRRTSPWRSTSPA